MNILRKPFRYRNYNVVLILIGINILVYLVEFLFRDLLVWAYLSMIPALVTGRGYVWQFVSYMFVHDPNSIGHILFNMLALFIFGTQVERQMGSREFLLYYLLTGILAGIFSFGFYFFAREPLAVLMGASGAIFAVQLAYATFFPNAIIYIWGIIPLRAPVMVLVFTGIGLFMMFTGLGGNVAHITHLAGFVFGWLYFLVRFGINPWREMRR